VKKPGMTPFLTQTSLFSNDARTLLHNTQKNNSNSNNSLCTLYGRPSLDQRPPGSPDFKRPRVTIEKANTVT
jgi:hypothetical protein